MSSRSLLVLIVDDDRDTTDSTALLLTLSGHEARCAYDGPSALAEARSWMPDVVLLDLQMPRLPGLEAMRAIMSGSPTVKILLLTSTITTQQIIEALQIGARGIVLKGGGDEFAGRLRGVDVADTRLRV